MDFIIEAIMFVMMSLMWTVVMWGALMATMWYVFLIPFAIGCVHGAYRKNWKYPLIGLAVSFFGSWVIAFISVFFIRF
jgi:hypothetical protein